jgi:flavodoxin
MKILVAYYSETGNTKKIAEAIFDAIDVEKECKSIQDVANTEGYDLIFYGFPVQMHSVPAKAAAFIAQIPAGQKIAFFSTHGSLRGGQLPQQALEHALGLAAKLKVIGHFNCRGKVSQKIIDALEKDPVSKAWVEEARGALCHPDEHDLEDAGKFAREMRSKV